MEPTSKNDAVDSSRSDESGLTGQHGAMDCFLLGSGGTMPMPHRRLTSMAIRHDGRIFLFDCGEGTQVPYKEAHLGVRNLALVAISHLHADHILGLPGMLMLRARMPDPTPLTVLGPPNIGRFRDSAS